MTMKGDLGGLMVLASVPAVAIKQRVNACEVITHCEMQNRYAVKTTTGQKLFEVTEDTGFCNRLCCGYKRQFDMNFHDLMGTWSMRIYRPLTAATCLLPCWFQSLDVYSVNPNLLLGRIKQQCTLCCPEYAVYNAEDQPLFTIKGPCVNCSCCSSDVRYEVLSQAGGQSIASITKHWSGCLRECFTDADHFTVTFPPDMEVGCKALLIGSTFLIDMMFYEN